MPFEKNLSNPLKFLFVFAFVGGFSAIIYYTHYYPYLGADDAYIYFVYAKNMAHGHGFVYNTGEERVEGFTSMLWLLIIFLFYTITSHFQVVLLFLNLLMISYALYRLIVLIDEFYVLPPKKLLISTPSFILLLLVLIVKGFIDWTIFSLLETGLWSFLLILASVFLLESAMGKLITQKRLIYFSILMGLLVLTRPESILWCPIFIILLGIILIKREWNYSRTLKTLLIPIVFYIVISGLLTAFRLYYFGYPFPNTYYAKVSADKITTVKQGIVYLLYYPLIYPLHMIPVVGAVFSLWILFKKKLLRKEAGEGYDLSQFITSIILLATLIIPLATGGDHFYLYRLFQPLVPVFFLIIVNIPFLKKHFLHNRSFQKYNRPIFILLLIPIIYFLNRPKYFLDSKTENNRTNILNEFVLADEHAKESSFLNNFFDYDPKPSIGRIWAGGYAYTYEGKTIDVLGLNNTLMAHALKQKKGLPGHSSFDKKTFYILHPDLLGTEPVTDTTHFILKENTSDFDKSFESQVMKNIYRDEDFINRYLPVLIHNDKTHSNVFSYVRNDYIDTLKMNGLRVQILTRIQR